MKVGSLVYATEQGLGYLGKSFVDAGVVTDVMVIRHGRRQERDDWYNGSCRIMSMHDTSQRRLIEDFCASMEAMLFFETPFLWELIPFCQRAGVKVALMPMHECMPDPLPAQPDLFLCPSLLDLQCYPGGVFIPVPVDVPWKQRTRAEVFVHNAGHGGLRGRNGTAELIEAIDLVKSPAKFIIRSQEHINIGKLVRNSGARVQMGTSPRESLYSEGDVFVFPEKFNGLSLPLQEAYASGMLVMSTDRFPMNTWLPRDPLIPSPRSERSRVSPRCREFDEAIVDPADIAAHIDRWYGRDVSEFSLLGQQWAEENSWATLKPRYVRTLERLCA